MFGVCPRLRRPDRSASLRLMDALLDELEAAVEERRLDARDDVACGREHVLSCMRLAGALDEAGRAEEALARLSEGLATGRWLVERDRRAHAYELAGCLEAYARLLRELGRRADALEATREAVVLRRIGALRRGEPLHAVHLGACLWDFADDLAAEGRHKDVVPIAREALSIWRFVASAGPEYERGLALSYDRLSVALAAVGRRRAALKMSKRAFALLLRSEPGSHLVACVAHMADALDALGRSDDARSARELAEATEALLVPVEERSQ